MLSQKQCACIVGAFNDENEFTKKAQVPVELLQRPQMNKEHRE